MNVNLLIDGAEVPARAKGTFERRDPVTGAAYGYEIEGDRRYRLCAVFDTDTAVTRDAALGPGDWTHGAGRHCFDRIAAARGVGATVPAMPVAPGTERSAPAERVP